MEMETQVTKKFRMPCSFLADKINSLKKVVNSKILDFFSRIFPLLQVDTNNMIL